MARLSDSVAPEVQMISRGSALTRLATSWRAFSTASSASQPKAWLREAVLPKLSYIQGTMFSTTRWDRKSDLSGKSVTVRVELGARLIIKQEHYTPTTPLPY